MDTNRRDKERSGYLAKQRNATSLVGPRTLNLVKFWRKVGKVTWKKMEVCGNVLASVFWSAPAAATGKVLGSEGLHPDT